MADLLAVALCVPGPHEVAKKLVASFYRVQATFWYASPSGSPAQHATIGMQCR